jgi:hypothetical protein
MSLNFAAPTNRQMVESLRTSEGQNKFAQKAGEYIRDKLRETSVFDQILAPQPVTEDELVPGISDGSSTTVPGNTSNTQGDTVHVIRDIQIGATAMLMDFRGQPKAQFINGRRFAIPFGVVTTQRYEKTQEELLASKYDILKVLEDTAYLETHTQKDVKFLDYCEQAVATTGQALTADGPMQRDTFRAIQHPALQNQLQSTVLLMSKAAFTDLGLWDSIDLDSKVSEVTENGYVMAKVAGMKYVISLKSSLFDTYAGGKLATTKVWAFPDPEFLGYNFFLNEYQVWNSWEANLWRFQGWQTIGAGFGNINGITKVTVTY